MHKAKAPLGRKRHRINMPKPMHPPSGTAKIHTQQPVPAKYKAILHMRNPAIRAEHAPLCLLREGFHTDKTAAHMLRAALHKTEAALHRHRQMPRLLFLRNRSLAAKKR